MNLPLRRLPVSLLSGPQDRDILVPGGQSMGYLSGQGSLFGQGLPYAMESIPVCLAWAFFMRRKSHRQYPAFAAYLSCRLCILAALFVVSQAARFRFPDAHVVSAAYCSICWVGYLVGAAMALLAIRAIYARLMDPFPALHPIGRVGLRWATATAALIAVLSALFLFPAAPERDMFSAAGNCVMRGVGVLELCLLGFVLLSMQTLRFSWKSSEFGMALGLAMIAAAELAASAFAFRHSITASAGDHASQIVGGLAAMVWAAYFVRPAVETSEMRLTEPSALDRWNEVAAALAEPAPQVHLGSPTGGFFLDDVVKVVDKVMERNVPSPGK